MDSISPPVVLVGVSGTRASAVALRWAAAEEWRRDARLRVVRCWDPEFTAPYAGRAGKPADGTQHAAGESLAGLLGQVFGDQPPSWVTTELRRGVAERVLVSLSAGAELLVLGSAGQGGPDGQARAIGPVIRSCLSRAQCPVVVVGTGTKDHGHGLRSPLPGVPALAGNGTEGMTGRRFRDERADPAGRQASGPGRWLAGLAAGRPPPG
jgi:nucleotide-binding universal stress UspA family protein